MSNIISLFPMKGKLKKDTLPTRLSNDVRKFAASLMFKMHISEGIALVHYLGHGDESSNQRAIETWLLNTFSKEELMNQTLTLDTLQKTLTQFINTQQEDFTC